MEQILNFYYEDNAKKLRGMVDKILIKLKFYDVDNEDFYSLANEIFCDVLKRYDGKQGFDGFLYSCLTNKFKTEMTRRNRQKRQGDKMALSLETPIGENDTSTISDLLNSDINIEQEVERKDKNILDEQVKEYLNELSNEQKEIAILIMEDFSPDEIKEKLNLTDDEYKRAWNVMNSYEKKRILYQDNNDVEEEEMNTIMTMENVAETYKNTSYSIDSISKQLRKKRIKDDHILQRHSGQWQRFAKSELISDILRGKSLTQIIISEEIKNGVRMQWLIDGKQRCTTLDDYLHNGFAISKNVKNYLIKYQTTKLDEDGNEVLNEDGFVVTEVKEFDIRGKKFKQLPEELQDVFKDRQIPVLYNMNCTKKDIADDIARFNRSRPMNKAQNGWLGLDEYFAEFAENIAKMPFFQEEFKGSSYKQGNHNSGEIRRIVVEAVMVSDFLEDYDRDFNKMCEFLTEEASDSNFTEFYSLVERLTNVCDERVAKLFNKTDSFILFGLFSRFATLGVEDEKFIDFLVEFDSNLRSVKVNKISFEDLCTNKETGKSKGTKDRSVVVSKLDLLETLMLEYLHINKKDIETIEECDLVGFVKENVNEDLTEEDIQSASDLYEDLKFEVNQDSKLLNPRNNPSMIAIMAYAEKENMTLSQLKLWFINYFAKNNTFLLNQKQNYLQMVDSLKKGAIA